MKISCIQKDPYGVFTILLDEEPWRDIHQSVFGKYPKFPKEINSKEEWITLFKQKEYSLVKQFVFRKLAKKSYYSEELIQKLKDNLVSTYSTNLILDECRNAGYINDDQWVEDYIRSCKNRKIGPRNIANKLREKGVPTEIIEEKLSQNDDTISQKEAIIGLINTKYRLKNLSDFKEKNKVIASLMRKGFNFDEIKAALDEKNYSSIE